MTAHRVTTGQPVRLRPDTPRLCDERGRSIVAVIPNQLKVSLVLFGFFAVAIAGFLGNSRSGLPAQLRFYHPWPLFAFFCALAVTLVRLCLRGEPLTRQRRLGAAVVVVCALVDAIIYFAFKPSLHELLRRLGDLLGALQAFLASDFVSNLLRDPGAYTILNYVVLAILVIDMTARWIRHLNRRSQHRPQRAGPSGPLGLPPGKVDELQELLASDLVVRGAIVFAMGLLMTFVVPTFTTCGTITIVTFTSTCSNSAWPPLWLADDILGLGALAVGLILLAVIAQGRVLERRQAGPGNGDERSAPGGMFSIGQEIAGTVVDILIGPIRDSIVWLLRFIRINFRPMLHFLAWAVLMLVGITGAGGLAIVIQNALLLPSQGWIVGASALPESLVSLAISSGLSAVFVLGVVSSLAILAEDRGVVVDVLRFLRLIGIVFLILFCLFSFALTGFSALLYLSNHCGSSNATSYCGPHDVPFPIGPLTIFSFALLVIFAVMRTLNVRLRAPVND